MKKYFNSAAKTTLILVYLVIVAGALVRMTGSGMGCPDWPKCFGYYIPPTDISEIEWSPNHEFKKGQIIIHEEKLVVAKETFTTSTTFEDVHWEPYTKHDYASFNAMHTWIEYINRLCGALAGMATFAMAIFSFSFWKEKKAIVLLSWLAVFMMGFQAWLGATVVYSVLAPVRITVHMVMALLIVAVILYILHLANRKPITFVKNRLFQNVVVISIILTLIQVVLGTQVRQLVDEQVKAVGYNPALWLDNPTVTFYIHRTFSFIVLGINLFLYLQNKKLKLGYQKINWVLLLLIIEVISGVGMYYFDFPFGLQAIHLVIASILFGVQFYLILETRRK
ncbi:COX15/CtaA family protein [Flavobacterium sp. '19STA2R22 D10 B1']|uniref:COX15/CtaA family protein n=1 Tax=Flavobacterium aerium TaxID=3037261 RepID=UPI00278BAF39|nr:COX15/CtaA family protein [Flavobacterium sp. '19STA2R22 D10 B1']